MNLAYSLVIRLYSMLVVQSSLLTKVACWPNCKGKWLVRARVRTGARECTTFFSLVLQNVMNIFVFVGSVAAYESL